VVDDEPAAFDLCIYLAGAAFPVELGLVLFVYPEGVNVDNGEPAVELLSDLNADGFSVVVGEGVVGEQAVPNVLPPPRIKPPHRDHPGFGVVALRVRRPNPDHVGVEQGDEGVGVEVIPGVRFGVDDCLDFVEGELPGVHLDSMSIQRSVLPKECLVGQFSNFSFVIQSQSTVINFAPHN